MGGGWIEMELPNGEKFTAHVKTTKRTKFCKFCGRLSEALCDYPVGHGKTCDAPLCKHHRVHQGGPEDDIDYCPTHALIAQEATPSPKTRVVNVRREKADVYIGRPSPWGNPFREGPGCTREQAIEKYRQYILGRPDLLAKLPTLKGKTLGCWCKPAPCHGDVLIELIERGEAHANND